MTHPVHAGILRAMSTDLRAAADANLAAAAARLRMSDPRPAYRDRLRLLKDQNPEAFKRALRHYEETVLPALVSEGDVMAAWVEYGAALAAFTAPGRMVWIDGTGASRKYAAPVQEGALILHIPDDNAAPVLPAALPANPTPAQQAAFDLLVTGRLEL